MRKELFTVEPKLTEINVTDDFWKKRMEQVRTKVLPYEWDALNDRIEGATSSHAVANFRLAAELTRNNPGSISMSGGTVRTEEGQAIYSENGEGFKGFVFQDSDIAKWLEAISYTLMWHRDAGLERTADEAIELVCSAQQEDGYLDTFYIINGLDKKWTNLQDNHELYCLGHLLEAAVAYYEATGKDKLLKAMMRYVDYVDTVFGPEEWKKKGYPGHEEIELALVKLYQITENEKYLKLAKYFIYQRGTEPNYFVSECEARNEGKPYSEDLTYYQAHMPVTQQQAAVGHAVRAVYLYTGMADVARLTGDDVLFEACERLWKDVTERQMYITGSIGSSHLGEAFTFDYDLPNDSVYGETCAAIGLALFAKRMLKISPKREYGDVLEKLLYNGIISGISLDGTRFFYVNPLEVFPEKNHRDMRIRHVKTQRQKWFGCACCPPNIARLTASVGSYMCTYNDSAFYTHIPAASETGTELNGTETQICVKGNYPWDGNIRIEFNPQKATEFTYGIRIPSWCNEFRAELNGQKLVPCMEDGYLILRRTFEPGDILTLSLLIEPVIVVSNSKVRNNIGKAAVMRGPVVYCAEEADNGSGLHMLRLPSETVFTEEYGAGPGGSIALSCEAFRECSTDDGALYRPLSDRNYEKTELRLIPYYAWANRGEGEMLVWLNRK